MDVALRLYQDASEFIMHLKQYSDASQDLRKTILQNITLTMNKTGDFKEAKQNATNALLIDAKSVKALYLRSIACMNLKEYD
jgi:Flp pilus assembly protein TadD